MPIGSPSACHLRNVRRGWSSPASGMSNGPMNDLVERLAQQASLTANVVWVLVALALALVAGSALRVGWLLRPAVEPEVRRGRLGSLATWWALFALLVLIAV